jgi:DNA-binding beta-propeller fold protein YncE
MPDKQTKELINKGLGFPWRIVVDIESGKMYWTNMDKNLVQRSDLDGSNAENLAVISYPQGIALDTLQKKIIIAESGTPMIIKMNYNGSEIDTLIIGSGMADPDDIKLDISRKRMYWVDTSLKNIWTAGMDGTDPMIIKFKDIVDPQAIDIDPINNLVYIADSGDGTIKIGDIESNKVNVLIDNLAKPTAIVLSPLYDKIFWIDVTSGKIQYSSIPEINITDLYSQDIGNFHSGMDVIKQYH